MTVAIDPGRELGGLSRLVGVWEGTGRGSWAGGAEFAYRERASFVHTGKPLLSYAQQTWSADDGRPLHSEQGYWRAAAEGAVELVLAHGIGAVEVAVGRWEENRLHTHSTELGLTPTAKHVTAVERVVRVDADVLTYTLAMAVDDGSVRPHLRARLRRIT